MLVDKDAVATVGVKNLSEARNFYENIVGLTVMDIEGDGAVVYRTGSTKLLVYVSAYAGNRQTTAVTWEVGGDVERIVRELRSKGVRFEHYDLPGTTRDGDIHIAGELRLAWLKDPDGNILALVGQ